MKETLTDCEHCEEQEVLIRVPAMTFINTGTMLPDNLNAYTLSKKQFVEWLKIKSNKLLLTKKEIISMGCDDIKPAQHTAPYLSAKELKKIKFLEAWAILGPIVGILIGLIF